MERVRYHGLLKLEILTQVPHFTFTFIGRFVIQLLGMVRSSPDSSLSALGFTILGNPASSENFGASVFTKSKAEVKENEAVNA